jgi:hypothetical protein
MNRKAVSIETYRPGNGNKTIKPGEFKKLLTKLCTSTTMQELTNVEIGNLIHYLVLEELGEVSWSKLNKALR